MKLLIPTVAAILTVPALAIDNTPPANPLPGNTIMADLTAGNQRFLKGETSGARFDLQRVKETAKGQKPLVTVLTCSDSRVSPEIIFDQGLGDIFVIRVAGNVVDNDEIGTIEYGTGHLNTPLLVVMGHTKCGAVNAAATRANVHGCIPKLIAHINPAVGRARSHDCSACSHDLAARAVYENVWVSIEDLFNKSEEIRELVASRKLMVIGAVYDIETGKVQWLGEHKNQTKLLVATRMVASAHGAPKHARTAPKHH